MKITCTEKTFYKGRLWEEGETTDYTGDPKKIPNYFGKEGAVKAKPKDTAATNPTLNNGAGKVI